MIMVTITCDTDAEQEQLLAAMHDGTLDTALAALGWPDFQLARREPGRPPRPFAGGGMASAVTHAAGGAISGLGAGGGGQGSSVSVIGHNHGPDVPCPPDCPSLYVNPTGGPSWTERHNHRASEPCGPMCPGNPSKPGGNGGPVFSPEGWKP